MASFTDADLIARALLQNDGHAFGELVRRHQSPVRGFLLKMNRGDAHLADDLAQETFVKAWKHLGSFRGGSKFSTWLFGIACNEWRMYLRQRKEVALADLVDPPPEPQVSGQAVASHLRMDLAAAMMRLGEAERAVVLLCCQNGFTHDEAAQILDCPVGTVKTNVLRGKEKLRRNLGL